MTTAVPESIIPRPLNEKESTIETKPSLETIKSLCKKGFYVQALAQAQQLWGNIERWQTKEQLLIALRLYSHLGSDRKSDTILLTLWRKDKTQVDVLFKILFYKLNKLGPILAQEFLIEQQAIFSKATATDIKLKADLLAFESILQRLFKNFTLSEQLLNQAITLNPDEVWYTTLKINLLLSQEQNQQASELAHQHFNENPNPFHLVTLSRAVQSAQGLDAAIALSEQHTKMFESADLWLELASLLSKVSKNKLAVWHKCQQALDQYHHLKICNDKTDEQLCISLQGQIAIAEQNIEQAISILKPHKHKYWQIVTENLRQSNGELKRKVLDVPFLRQEHLTCAPTTLAAIAQYWGKDADQKQIADSICYDGTPDTLERKWLRDNDFYFVEFELTPTLTFQLIDKNIPFALVTSHGFSSHIQVVIGYNQQVGTMYIMDPSESSMQEMLIKETIEVEAYCGTRCLAIVPVEQQSLLDGMHFPAGDLYPLWDEYSCAKEINDAISAKAALDKLVALDAEHRITLTVKRDYASWNNDVQTILLLNEQLLKKYPNETILHSSRYYCLRDLGQRQQGLNNLYDHIEKVSDTSLLSTLFDELHDTNENPERINKLLYKLKTQACYSASTYWSIASYYWAQQNFELALNYYLTAHCLDETNNFYVESYFKASRFLKQQQQALNFLKARFEKYNVRSPLPAISLFKAYEFSNLEHLGFEYLSKALALHPKDTELLNFLAEELVNYGQFKEFDDIAPLMKATLSTENYESLIAQKQVKQGQSTQALKHYHKMFTASPLVSKHANNYFQLLNQLANEQQIDDSLIALVEQYPNNATVLDYIADWHSNNQQKAKALQQLVAVRPDYGHARRRYIEILNRLGDFQQALTVAQQTCEIIVGEVENIAYLAQCYLKNNQVEQARKYAKQVLGLRIDDDLAFNVLLEASVSDEDKVSSLDWVFQQIQQQVIFGDSAWNFWFTANAILTKDKLHTFVDYLLSEENHLWYAYSIAAMFYMQNSELERAKAILIEGKNKFPLTPRLYLDLGRVYEADNDVEHAIESYCIAIEQNPAWSEVAKKLSDIYEKHKGLDKAVAVIESVLKHNNDDGILHGYLADLYIKLDEKSLALISLSSAVEKNLNYPWAWDHIIDISAQLNKGDYAVTLAKQQSEKMPYRAGVWRNLAYVSANSEKKVDYLQQALRCDNRYIPAYEDLTQLAIDSGDYQQALTVLASTPWLDELPHELAILQAELLAQTGEYKQACQRMKNIVSNIHGSVYLWKKLFAWLEVLKEQQEYIRCNQALVEQNPHDSDALCIAGENLLAHGGDKLKDIADDYLLKAYQLAPNDQYTVLTYVDRLIEKEQFEQALQAIIAYEAFETVGYVITRKIALLCQLNAHQQAFNLFTQMIKDNMDEYWVLNHAYQALNKTYSLEKLLALFSGSFEKLSKQQAYFWADIQCNNKHSKMVITELDNITAEQVWQGACQALFEYWNDKKIVPKKAFVDKHFENIISDGNIVGQLSNAYAMNNQYHSAIKLFQQVTQPEKLPAYVFYHYRLSLQMLNRWDEAAPYIEKGLQQTPDNTLHNLKLWQVFEQFRNNEALSQADLDMINYQELVEAEQYIYTVLCVDIALAESSLEDKLNELTPLLRQCQQTYQAAVGQHFAVYARNLLRDKLKRSMTSTGFVAKLKLWWWISNRF